MDSGLCIINRCSLTCFIKDFYKNKKKDKFNSNYVKSLQTQNVEIQQNEA